MANHDTPPKHAKSADAARRNAARTMLHLCLDAHQKLPPESVRKNEDGSTTIRTWVVTRVGAMAASASSVWLETTTPVPAVNAVVVSKLGHDDMGAEPKVVLAMEQDASVTTEADLASLRDYSALLLLALGRF